MAQALAKKALDGEILGPERLRELLDYDPLTGVFSWRVVRKGRRIGDRAGSVATNGYRSIRLDDKLYYAHRLAWLYMTGEWPSWTVDHKNGQPGDDRWENLRAATQAQNISNQRLHKNNTSGFKGVYWSKRRRKWCASIMVERKTIHLGFFATAASAGAAYATAAPKYHGEFARVA